MKIEGAFAAMATPFAADGTVARDTLRAMVDFMIERGIDGIFAASTVGEYVHLSDQERYELVRSTVEFARGRVPVLAGAGDIGVERVIRHCRELGAAGAAAAVIAPPYYYLMRQDDLIAHYQQVAERIDLPFVLYHIPQFSNSMRAETMIRIVESCRPVAIKNSSPDVVEMMAVLRGVEGKGIPYLVGPDELLFTGLELGAAGSMSGLTGIVPEAVRALIDAFRRGDTATARRLQFEMLELITLVADIPFPAWIKLMLSARGFEMGPPVGALARATLDRIEARRPAVAAKIDALVRLAQ
jgi:4-hydroxy-tetrahydrodipicolinate synthase